MFKISISGSRIELIPLEISERTFTEEEHAKLELLAKKERGKEKRVTDKFIKKLKKGT